MLSLTQKETRFYLAYPVLVISLAACFLFYKYVLQIFPSTLVLYCNPLSTGLLSALLFLFGFGLGAFMLVFAMGKEMNDLSLTATVIAMINSSDAVLDALTEPFIGKLLDMGWDGKVVHGVHQFSIHSSYSAICFTALFSYGGNIIVMVKRDSKEST